MSLTKPQKKFILDNADYLTVFELSDRTGIDKEEIVAYLKSNKVKPLIGMETVSDHEGVKQVRVVREESKHNKMKPFFEIVKENWKILLGIVILVFVLYANSLNGDFVSDDYATITQNPDIFKWSSAKGIGFAGVYKIAIAKMFGVSSPVPFHVCSVVLYALICVLAFVFLCNVFDKLVAITATLLFLVAPMHVEAVSWISGEPYLLMALFILIFLNAFVLFVNSKNKKYLIILLIASIFLYYTDKLRGSSAIFLSFLYLVAYKDGLNLKFSLWKVFLIAAGVFAVAFVISMPAIKSRIGSVNSGYNATESIFYKPWEQYPTSVTKYMQLMLLPTDLTLYHTMYIIPIWINWSVILLYLLMLGYFYKKNKDIFFALGFIFLAAAASISPVKVSWLVAERYLFLGSLGFYVFLILFFRKIAFKNLSIFLTIFAIVIFGYSARTIYRNHDWRTNHLLWVNTVQVSPNSHNAWNNIGDDYDKLAAGASNVKDKEFYFSNAIKGFTQSTVVKPNYADAYHNRANIFFKVGRLDLARDSYMTAINYSPGLYQTYTSLAQVEMQDGNPEAALGWTDKLAQIMPNDPQTYYVRGVIFAQYGALDEAVKALNMALKINPNYSPAQQMLDNISKIKK